MASIDGGFYCASDYTLIVGVPRAAVAIYLHYYTRGGGGLTGRIGRKRRNTSAAARRTPSPGAPLDGGFICASADTFFYDISRFVLSIFQFFTPKWRGDPAAAPGGGGGCDEGHGRREEERMAVGQRTRDEKEAMGTEEWQEAEERAAAERTAREVKARGQRNAWRQNERCAMRTRTRCRNGGKRRNARRRNEGCAMRRRR